MTNKPEDFGRQYADTNVSYDQAQAFIKKMLKMREEENNKTEESK